MYISLKLKLKWLLHFGNSWLNYHEMQMKRVFKVPSGWNITPFSNISVIDLCDIFCWVGYLHYSKCFLEKFVMLFSVTVCSLLASSCQSFSVNKNNVGYIRDLGRNSTSKMKCNKWNFNISTNIDFHQWRWLFNNQENNSHDPTFIHNVLSCLVIVSMWLTAKKQKWWYTVRLLTPLTFDLAFGFRKKWISWHHLTTDFHRFLSR